MDKTKHPSYQLALSAKSERDLIYKIGALQHFLVTNAHVPIEDIIFSANLIHKNEQYRLTIYSLTHAELISALQEAYLNNNFCCITKHPRMAFLFTGQGAQYPGMMQQLYESEVTFKSTIDKCAELTKNWLDMPLHELLFNLSYEELKQTRHTNSALFAVELALTYTLQHYGVRPDIMLGHSIGEYVAAVIADSIILEDALLMINKRAELLHELRIEGRMLALKQSEEITQALVSQFCSDHPDATLDIALINSANQTVVAGSFPDLSEFYTWLDEQNISSSFLSVYHAFHSSLMKPILNEYEKTVNEVAHKDPNIPIVSNLTGRPFKSGQLNPHYWCKQLHKTVRFYDGLKWMAKNDVDIFLEVGPHPALISAARSSFKDIQARWLATLRHNHREWDNLLATLTELYLAGVDVNWAVFARANGNIRHPVPLNLEG